MKIYNGIEELIGNTPLVHLKKCERELCPESTLLAKLEYFNPAGSAKDRVALNMILCAEEKGILKPDSVIIEPTSGNTGIGIAAVAAARGYRVILTMPDTMSTERRNLLAAYGAELVLTPGAEGMNGAVTKAEELKREIPESIIAGQFDNPDNPSAHEKTTGPEIWEDTDGKVDIFVAGAGTGGTLSGTGKYLKSKNQDIQIIAVEPADSPLLSKGTAGAHKLQGIGANFVPKNLDRAVIDEIITVTTEEAYRTANKIVKNEGFLVGITSGAALFAAAKVASRPENKGKTVVALLPDSGERYLSTPGFLK